MGLGSSDLYCTYANPCCSAREINSTIIHKRPSFKRTQVTRIFSRKPGNEFNFRLLFWLFTWPCPKKKNNVNYIPKIHGVSLWISSFLKLSQTAIPANIGSNLAVLCLKMAVTVTLLNCVHKAHFLVAGSRVYTFYVLSVLNIYCSMQPKYFKITYVFCGSCMTLLFSSYE